MAVRRNGSELIKEVDRLRLERSNQQQKVFSSLFRIQSINNLEASQCS